MSTKIGEGGMGEVYQARDTTLDRDVAIKVPLESGHQVGSCSVVAVMRTLAAVALVAAACSSGDADQTASEPPTPPTIVPADRVLSDGSRLPPVPDVPDGPLPDGVAKDLDEVFATGSGPDTDAIGRVGASGDARVAWLMSDLLRFFPAGPVNEAAVAAFEQLTATTMTDEFAWGAVTDLLIGWDIPEPPGYVGWKRILFEMLEPGWEPFFADADADIDWRLISWGGVLIDDRPLDAVDRLCPRGCIPALNDPAVTDAAGGAWYADERVVFGVVVGGESRAYPKNIRFLAQMYARFSSRQVGHRRGKMLRMCSCPVRSGAVVCRSVDGRLRGPRSWWGACSAAAGPDASC